MLEIQSSFKQPGNNVKPEIKNLKRKVKRISNPFYTAASAVTVYWAARQGIFFLFWNIYHKLNRIVTVSQASAVGKLSIRIPTWEHDLVDPSEQNQIQEGAQPAAARSVEGTQNGRKTAERKSHGQKVAEILPFLKSFQPLMMY